MRYLSFDIEATGLEDHDYIIEFGAVPFDTEERKIYTDESFHCFIKCPPFEELKPKLNPWVVNNNKKLIEKAASTGQTLKEFKQNLEDYLQSKFLKEFFNGEKIVLFGKSLNAIDLPFLNRDLSREWMSKFFHHRTLDLSSSTLTLIDSGHLEPGLDSGSKMMEYFEMGEVSHTAKEDAINTARMYFKVLDKIQN